MLKWGIFPMLSFHCVLHEITENEGHELKNSRSLQMSIMFVSILKVIQNVLVSITKHLYLMLPVVVLCTYLNSYYTKRFRIWNDSSIDTELFWEAYGLETQNSSCRSPARPYKLVIAALERKVRAKFQRCLASMYILFDKVHISQRTCLKTKLDLLLRTNIKDGSLASRKR